ncbi:MAG: hypothetical protein HC884_02405 [Chloroflexaceae bacterium]|nr:hypothetical protein [Chloroflexaceae bacterium]
MMKPLRNEPSSISLWLLTHLVLLALVATRCVPVSREEPQPLEPALSPTTVGEAASPPQGKLTPFPTRTLPPLPTTTPTPSPTPTSPPTATPTSTPTPPIGRLPRLHRCPR